MNHLKRIKGLPRFMSKKIGLNTARGASTVEFAIATPVFLLLALGAFQWLQIYQAKMTLNHATFMAARAGSLNNGDVEVMQGALAQYLAPLYGPASGNTLDTIAVTGLVPQGSAANLRCIDTSALVLPLTSLERDVDEQNKTTCHDVTAHSLIRIINPTREAFDDFSADVNEDGVAEEIPNVDLNLYPSNTVGSASGVNIRDANLLKIEVRYAPEMKVPFVKYIFAYAILKFTEQPNTYEAQKLFHMRIPIRSSSTVRMQTPIVFNDAVLTRTDAENLVNEVSAPSTVQTGYEENAWQTVTGGPTGEPPFGCGT